MRREFTRRALLAGAGSLALSTRAGAWTHGAPSGGGTVTTFTLLNTSGSTRTNEPFSYGLLFADGDMPGGFIPQLVTGGSALANQSVDQVTTWPSGAMKRCLVSGIVPSFPSGGTAFNVNSVSGSPNTTGITLAAFQSWATTNSWNVTWSATIDGTTYTADANTALAGSATFSYTAASYLGQWLKNNICTEFICATPLSHSGTPHRIVIAYFHVRAYHPGGTIQDVRTSAFLQNGNVGSTGNGCVLFDSVTLAQNGSTVWSRSSRQPAATLTFPTIGSSTPDTLLTATAGSSVFTASDVGCVIDSNGGIALIEAQSGTTASVYVCYADDNNGANQTLATIAQSQAIASGSGTVSLNATDNGSNFAGCVRSGTAYIRAMGARNVRIYSASGHSGTTYTVNGTRADGTSTAETITGSAATIAQGQVAWDIITLITYTGGNAQTIAIGQGGFPSSAIASGSWQIRGFYMPQRTRTRNFITWHSTGSRNAPQYSNTYLINSKQIPNYDFNCVSNWATLDTANTTALNALPTGASGSLFPDSADYNLFPNNTSQYFGYQCHQGNGGAFPERAVFGQYEVTWLQQQTASSWRNVLDRAISVFAWNVWMVDENTGCAVDPANRTTLSNLIQSSSAVYPTMVATANQVDSGALQLIKDEQEHMGAKAAMLAYVVTGDMCFHECYQYESVEQWMNVNPGSFGNGYTRNTMFPSERGMAWRLRHMGQLLAWYPDATPSGFAGIQPKATIQAMFEGGTSTTGLVQNMNTAVTTGSDLNGITPAQKGNFHYITSSATSPLRWAVFQTGYLSMVLGHLSELQVLSTAGQSLWNYQAGLIYQLFNDAGVNPRFMGLSGVLNADNWMYTETGQSGGGGTPYGSVAAAYTGLQGTVFPVVANAVEGSRTVNVAVTLTATSGASVTMSFGTTQLFVGSTSDMNGANVADAGTGRGTITAVASDGKSCTVNIPGGTPFSSTNLSSGVVRIGAPNGGTNNDATCKFFVTDTGLQEAAYDVYGALANIASISSFHANAVTANSNVKTWMQNDGFYLNNSSGFTTLQSMMLPR